jgi:hypothetical protein
MIHFNNNLKYIYIRLNFEILFPFKYIIKKSPILTIIAIHCNYAKRRTSIDNGHI